MIQEVNNHLLSYVDLHDDISFKLGLFDNWYEKNYLNLMSAIKETEGIKLILDVNNFNTFEKYCKKLFLFADVLVLRDSIKREENEFERVFIPDSKAGWLDKNHINFESLPPIGIRPPEGIGYWTSEKVNLNNGEKVPIATKFATFFSSQVYDWILNNGRKYIETGEIVYAPFIPPIELELKFMQKGYNIPDSYNLQTLYCNEYEWLNENNLNSILMLKLPTVENIDIHTLNQIKQDHFENYKLFRNDLISSITEIKSNFGSSDFLRELKYIQKNKIEDNIDKISNQMKSLNKMRTLRKLGLTLGVIGLDFSLFGGTFASIPLLEGAGLAIEEAIARLQEKGLIQDNPYYFLWKVKNTIEN